MIVFRGICIEDDKIVALNGDTQEIKRGQEYTISAPKDGMVTVFSTFWVSFPAERFAGVLPLVRVKKQ